MATSYRYAILLSDPQGRLLGQVPVEVDWEPAREWTLLEILRHSPDSTAFVPGGGIEVQPLWHPQAGPPHVAGVQSRWSADDRSLAREFTLRYFKHSAEEAAETLVADGRLQRGERFCYGVCAYPAPAPEANRPKFTVEEVVDPLPLQRSAIAPLLESAILAGQVDERDVPVFIPQSILDEFTEQTKEAGPLETGGFLIGEIHRDIEQPAIIFLKINALVPATHTEAGSKRLMFTPESFSAVDAAIQLRGRGELSFGWAHSHPQRYWCLDCPAEQRAQCPLQSAGGWFSRDDRAVHRTVFCRAYTFALLATHMENGVSFTAFGWRQGRIVLRGFYVRGATRPVPAACPVPTLEEGAYAGSCSG